MESSVNTITTNHGQLSYYYRLYSGNSTSSSCSRSRVVREYEKESEKKNRRKRVGETVRKTKTTVDYSWMDDDKERCWKQQWKEQKEHDGTSHSSYAKCDEQNEAVKVPWNDTYTILREREIAVHKTTRLNSFSE